MANYFLKIEGVPGGCTISGFEKQIEIASFAHNSNQPTSPVRSSGGGGTTSKAYHSDLTLSKQADASTPMLMKNLWEGKTIPKAIFTCCRMDGTTHVPYLVYTLQDVVISNHSISGGGDTPTEKISLAYATIQTVYKEQAATGNKQGQVTAQQSLLTGKVS